MILDKSEAIRIAETDIECYKKVGVEEYNYFTNTYIFKPYYYDNSNIRYELNREYTTEIKEVIFSDDDNGFGESAFDTRERIDYNIELGEALDSKFLRTNDLKLIGSGFHSSKTLERISKIFNSDGAYVKCNIPKGSEYYESKSGLYVSNKMVITEIID